MGNFPWGPHGPETSPNQIRPNPTPADPVAPFGQPDGNQAQPTMGSAGGGANPFLSVAISLMMVPLVWMFWVCLYPLTAASAVFTGFLSWEMLSRVLTASDEASVAELGGIVAGFAVAVMVSRMEYKLAQNAGLWWARHAVRLVLFGALAIPWIQQFLFDAKVGNSTTRYVFAVLSNPRTMISMLTNPQNLAIVLAVMVAMHFLLWKAERLRAFWHRRLFWLGLK